MVILESESFVINFTVNIVEVYTPVRLIFVHNMILPIKHNADREILCQKNQVKIHKYNNGENIRIFE